MTLFPVVMPVIEAKHKPSGKEKVDYLSWIAREALKVSAERSRVRLGGLLKDEKGVPCPVAGIYWSLSHKPKYVAAVVSKDKVGIDIEEMKPRAESLFARVASDEEWELKERSWDTFRLFGFISSPAMPIIARKSNKTPAGAVGELANLVDCPKVSYLRPAVFLVVYCRNACKVSRYSSGRPIS